ncbi:hypothetical protein C2E23DRAFT_724660 [Lenzites betulinus]|nr:hypothetical protein C2E23DRAFT_724660 [Lenzites betulinus]
MTDVDLALADIQMKEQNIRIACVEFDLTLSNLRQTLQLPASRTSWTSAMANRLSFLNKQYRTNLKNDFQAVSTTMRQTYAGHGHANTCLVTQLMERIQSDNAALARVEELMNECQVLYDARVNDHSLDILSRVQFYRGMPALRQGLDKARGYNRRAYANFTCWKQYFIILSSESMLSKLLQDLRSSKLTKSAAEGKVIPVFDRLHELSDVRDTIINEASALGMKYESEWMEHGNQGIHPRELHRALRELDVLFDRAQEQRPVQEEALRQVADLTSLAAMPTSLPGPDGTEIMFDRLRIANLQFDAIHGTCEATESVSQGDYAAQLSSHIWLQLLDVVKTGLQAQKHNLS